MSLILVNFNTNCKKQIAENLVVAKYKTYSVFDMACRSIRSYFRQHSFIHT
jgi:hypothetical protein